MRRSLGLMLAVAGAVFALDQWTKRWATRSLADRAPIQVLDDFVRLTYTRNSGVAFGLGAGSHFPFYIFSVIATLAILALFLRGRVRGRGQQIALSLILGGALGNLVDRITTGLVVDFIEVGVRRWRFPVFNVADSSVTIGVLLFALRFGRRPEPRAAEPNPATAALAGAAEGAADAGAHGAGAPRGGAAGPLPGGGPGGSLA